MGCAVCKAGVHDTKPPPTRVDGGGAVPPLQAELPARPTFVPPSRLESYTPASFIEAEGNVGGTVTPDHPSTTPDSTLSAARTPSIRSGARANGHRISSVCGSASGVRSARGAKTSQRDAGHPPQPDHTGAAQYAPAADTLVGVPRWGGGGGTVGTIGPAAHRIAARPSIIFSRVKREATIFEMYKLTNAILGTGINGAVRVATNKHTGHKFAIKTLSLQNISPKKAAMLHNEVAIYLKLDHPNIVKLIEVYEEEKAIHLVMELCDGGELYDRLASKRRYSEADAARVTAQMLEAISYCHFHRTCHRDLKLENWVYAGKKEDDPLKLIDFGFSRIFNPGIPMTAMHGTVYYVSPEVMDGCYKEKCDIWSVGVIVYMLLSGSPPFNGSHDHEILIKIKRAEFSFPGSRWSGVSQEAKDFICTLLVKDPEKRTSAAEALKHPWLTQLNSRDKHELHLEVLTQMRKFALANVMRRAALGIVALSMTPQEARDVEAQFKMLDTSGSGTIQLHELASVLIEKLHISQSECQSIFSRLDQSGDREVHYSEFMASTLAVKMLKDEQLVRDAFRKFDVEGNGYITVENLRQVLGDTYTGTRVEDIVKYCDHKGNNVIDYEEFLSAILSDDVSASETPI